MELDHVEYPAGLEVLGNDLSPSFQLRQPNDSPVGSKDDVELPYSFVKDSFISRS
jgi:hypothetical protein